MAISNDVTTERQGRTLAWRAAVIALLIFGVLSEATYLLIGMVADACFVQDINCEHVSRIFAYTFFEIGTGESGAKYVYPRGGFGLPGFSSAFHAVLGAGDPSSFKFLLSTAASILVGLVMIAGFVGQARHVCLRSKLGLGIVFASGWFLLYNMAEASLYGLNFIDVMAQRYPEIPITVVSLLIISLFTRRRSGQPPVNKGTQLRA